MAKTIQGKPENEIQKELMTILKTEDYSIMDVTNKPYFKAETLTSKVRNLLGFNWETDPNILNSDGDRLLSQLRLLPLSNMMMETYATKHPPLVFISWKS